MRPCATPARITPSAVPKPAVASEPVLQWVSTLLPGSISAAPSAPMRRFAARSSVAISVASSRRTSRQFVPASSSARRMRASAQARFTAVGRAALRCANAGSSAASACAVRRVDIAPRKHRAPGRGDADRRGAAHGEVGSLQPPRRGRRTARTRRRKAACAGRAAQGLRPSSGSDGRGRNGRNRSLYPSPKFTERVLPRCFGLQRPGARPGHSPTPNSARQPSSTQIRRYSSPSCGRARSASSIAGGTGPRRFSP